ncbi:MAG: glycosyltransferase family 2 protein [Bryobacteraceae bacterium]|nr:glycosyltransferase family 2 protein [Bryobacteraceae bacterium]
MASLSIVIPAFNEQQRLPSTLDSILQYLRQGEWTAIEALVVDDGSTDGTAAVVAEWRERRPEIRLLSNPGNRGKGYSVRQGMLNAKGDWVLFTDADLSAPIEELAKLMEAVRRQGADVAIGSRALDRSLIGVHQSVFREQAGRVFNLAVRLLTGLPFWDTQCGFKLFSSEAAKAVFKKARLDRFGFDVEALFLARKLGFCVVEAPVRWDHVEGTKVSMFRDSLDMFLDLLRVRWNQLRGYYR